MKRTLRFILPAVFLTGLVLFILTGAFPHPETKTEPAFPAGNPDREETTVPLKAEECLNSGIAVPRIYRSCTMTTSSGEEVPDIMSEEILKSDMRKTVRTDGENVQELHQSGPSLVINGHEIPKSGFWASLDRATGTVEYYICPACFALCGFSPGEKIPVTCFDDALLQAVHGGAVAADRLEIHTTWILTRYCRDTNTYFFEVTENGPFSGISDVFSVYSGVRRFNTMPIKDSVYGYQKCAYSVRNDYWSRLGLSRNALRIRMNQICGTAYNQLPYDQDFVF